jgi:hypothetical protein
MEVTLPLGSLVTFAAPPRVCTARVVNGPCAVDVVDDPRPAEVFDVPRRPEVLEELRPLFVAAVPLLVLEVPPRLAVEELAPRPFVVVEVPERDC